MLYLTEIFRSVQGETSFTGQLTTFIRLSGCNLRCSWCDTEYSFKRGKVWEIESIVEKVRENGCPYVCVTGGEPLLQKDVYLLMHTLCNEGFTVNIETGGSLPTEEIDPRVHVILDIKCPGSGEEKKNHWPNVEKIRAQDEVKFVIKDAKDYAFANEVCEKYGLKGNVLYSPVFGILDPKVLIEWMLQDKIPARLNLQMHKFIWDPVTKGV